MSTVLNNRLKQYVAAETAILSGGQSYKIGNRTLTRADLAEIRKEISTLLSAGATLDGASGDVPSRARRSFCVIRRQYE
jgi:hypothetical protein